MSKSQYEKTKNGESRRYKLHWLLTNQTEHWYRRSNMHYVCVVFVQRAHCRVAYRRMQIDQSTNRLFISASLSGLFTHSAMPAFLLAEIPWILITY